MERSAVASALGTAAIVAIVAGIGLWARSQPAETPITVAPLPAPSASPPDGAPRLPPPAVPVPTPPTSAPPVPTRIAVDVEGAVRAPGVYWMTPGDRVLDALRRAGGTLPTSNTAALNLAMPLRDGMKVTVPFGASAIPPPDAPSPSAPPPVEGGEAPFTVAGEAPEAVATARPGPAPKVRKGDSLAPGSVSMSRASVEEWANLPGIGPATAAKIVEERDRRGGFRRPEDLLDVRGIGPKKLERIRPFLAP